MSRTPAQSQRQPDRIDGRVVAVGAVGVLLLIALASALVRLLSGMAGTTTRAVTSRALQAPALSSTVEVRQLGDYQAAQRVRLDSYGWKDSEHRFAHIPIERAMQLLVQQPQLLPSSARAPATPSVGKPAPVDVPRPPDQPSPLVPRP